jgi:hypothetical protein
MYCPLCGSELVLLPRHDSVEIDWNLEGEALDEQIQSARNYEMIQREEYACPKECFGEDYPLYCHNPFGGIDSAPGDSWSLSWVK